MLAKTEFDLAELIEVLLKNYISLYRAVFIIKKRCEETKYKSSIFTALFSDYGNSFMFGTSLISIASMRLL